jgi:hypothetical protein
MGDARKLTEEEQKDFKSLERHLMRFFDKHTFINGGITLNGAYKKRKYKMLIARADLTSGSCTCFFTDSEDVKFNEEADILYCDVCKLPMEGYVKKDNFNDNDAP